MAKVIKAWGGFVDDKLDSVMANDGYQSEGLVWQIFKKKKDAAERYQDVRRLEIRES